MWIVFSAGECDYALRAGWAGVAEAGPPAERGERADRQWQRWRPQGHGFDEEPQRLLRACPPATLRPLLDDAGQAVHRLADGQVLAAVAERLLRGALAMFEAPRPRLNLPSALLEDGRQRSSGPLLTPAMLRPAPPPEQPAPAARPWIDPLDHIDPERQAAALRAAARHGLPFCEECARRRHEAELVA